MKELSNFDKARAVELGGFTQKDWEDYQGCKHLQYCDKGDHKQRSLYHQPNHQKHWRKK